VVSDLAKEAIAGIRAAQEFIGIDVGLAGISAHADFDGLEPLRGHLGQDFLERQVPVERRKQPDLHRHYFA
jgi:hypothetical protein